MRHLISMLLQNEAGALARVAGLFASRGYNIESLTVAATHDVDASRLTLVVFGDDAVVEQIIKQTAKLVDVIEIVEITRREHVERELLVARIDAGAAVVDACLAQFGDASCRGQAASRSRSSPDAPTKSTPSSMRFAWRARSSITPEAASPPA